MRARWFAGIRLKRAFKQMCEAANEFRRRAAPDTMRLPKHSKNNRSLLFVITAQLAAALLLSSIFIFLPAGAHALDASKLPTGTFVCKGLARECGAWAPKGENTCRTCKQPICKTENGNEVLAGQATENECYEGHGPAPLRVRPRFDLRNNLQKGVNK